MSWTARARTIETAVLLGPAGQDITSAVRGTINLERSTSSTVMTGTLPVKASQLAYFHANSWALGPQQIQIVLRARAGGTSTWTDWLTLFNGVAEAPSNAGRWQPSGTLRLVSHSYRWANAPLCVMIPPFSGLTRQDLLQQAIDTAGLGLTVSGSWPSGRVLTRPMDWNGQTLVQLLSRLCELEAGGYRETAGGLELFDLADCWGPAVTPLWEVEADYYSPAETPPARPVTMWIFSGTEPKLPDDGTTTTELPDDPEDPTGPRTVKTVTVTDGAISQEIEERYDLYSPRGVTPGAEEVRLVRRVTIALTHARNADLRPTGRLTDKITTVEEWKGIYTATGDSPNYTWADGQFSSEDIETFRTVRTITETYTYNADTCALEDITIETEEWFAALSETAFTDPEVTWPDGSLRIQDAELFELRSRTKSREGFQLPADPWNPDLSNYFGLGSSGGRVRWRFDGSERCAATYANSQARRDYQRATAWIETPDGLSHQEWVREWPATAATGPIPLTLGEEAGTSGLAPAETWKPVPEPIPAPPIESGTAPLYALRPWVTTFTITTRHPANIPAPEELLDAETVEEGQRAARYRARQQFADTLHLECSRPDPSRRPWDPITVTDPARNIAARQGWVRSQKFQLEPMRGLFKEALDVAIDPFPGTAP